MGTRAPTWTFKLPFLARPPFGPLMSTQTKMDKPNMRKNLLLSAVSAALMLSSPVMADMRIAANGQGDAVYIPYFTVEEGQDSLLTISNSSDRPMAARVLFSESLNGQVTLSFNLFLPPHGTWTAAVSDDGEGARLFSTSSVCSVPHVGLFSQDGVPFRPFQYVDNFPDGGPTSLARTRSGAIEIFALADLTGELAALTNDLNCSQLARAYTPGAVPPPPARGDSMLAPSAALSASVQVVSVSEGVVFAIPGVAIQGFSGAVVDAAPGDALPRLTTPTLAEGATRFETSLPSGRHAFAADRGVDAVSSLFMNTGLGGEVITDASLGASTRWLVSFPTKNAYVGRQPGSLVQQDGAPVAPFSEAFGAAGACEDLAVDKLTESGAPRSVEQQPEAGASRLCSEVNLVAFTAADGNGVDLLRFDEVAERTIAARKLDGQQETDVLLRGLPAVGFRLSNFVNGQAQPGVLANYSVALPLRPQAASND